MTISERPRGLLERIGLFPPLRIEVPEIIDHTIPQPEEVEIRVSGPKENCEVLFKSPQGEFSFNEIPPETRLQINSLPYEGFQHLWFKDREHLILIPQTKKRQRKEPALAILHEKGHAASQSDPKWQEKLEKTKKELDTQLLSRAINGFMWVSNEPQKRERERAALAVLAQEERRASAYALWQIRQLRKKGIDPVPHRKTLKELKSFVERTLKKHAHHEFGISVVREKPSLWQRLTDKLLRIPPREGNAAVYIPSWKDVRKRRLLRSSLETLGWIGGGTIIAPLAVALGYTVIGRSPSPESLIPFAIPGLVYGGVFALNFVKWR